MGALIYEFEQAKIGIGKNTPCGQKAAWDQPPRNRSGTVTE